MKNYKQTAEKCKQIFQNGKKLLPLKRVLASPTLIQTCTVSVLQPFLSHFFSNGIPCSCQSHSFWQVPIIKRSIKVGKKSITSHLGKVIQHLQVIRPIIQFSNSRCHHSVWRRSVIWWINELRYRYTNRRFLNMKDVA